MRFARWTALSARQKSVPAAWVWAAEWEGAGREPSYLLRGTRLVQFEGWAEGSAVALTQDKHTELETSIVEHVHR